MQEPDGYTIILCLITVVELLYSLNVLLEARIRWGVVHDIPECVPLTCVGCIRDHLIYLHGPGLIS